MDLSAFYAPYEGDGRRNSPYDPRMMVKVLIYAYATGTFSSRKMAKKPEEYPARARMTAKLATETGRRRYARRKWQAEAPIGWIKEALGFRRFSFRGLEKVQAEWTLVCLALNIKRLHTLQAA